MSGDVKQAPRRIRETPDRVERRALRLEEAAESLGVSLDFFREHIAPELKLIRKGRVRLVPVTELDRWVEKSASTVFNG
jgi:excisionase family DNA binding protein